MSVRGRLDQVRSSTAQKDRLPSYLSVLDDLLNALHPSQSDLSAFLDAMTDEHQVVSRPALTEYVSRLAKVEDRDARKELTSISVDKLTPRTSVFEEPVTELRKAYADLLEQDEEFEQAAKVLVGIPLESSANRTPDEKLQIYVRIVRLFLEEEDSTSAETYFQRAALLPIAQSDLATQLQFKLCQARMFDYARRFAEASSKYHELSFVSSLAEEERLFTLAAAIQCAVLAPAGPARSRILAALYRDERSAETQHFTILKKMFFDQIIRPDEVEGFAKTLETHQLARLPRSVPVKLADDTPDEKGKQAPETVLDRAVMEHNVLAASKIYSNISFDGLGLLLNLRPSASEAMARTMISQGRLRASIDQVDRLITFDVDAKEGDGIVSNVAVKAAGAAATSSADGGAGEGGGREDELAAAPATRKWDNHIRQTLQLCESVATRCEAQLAAAGIPVAAAR